VETSDRICGKRLRPLIPVLVGAMERHGHLRRVPEVRTRLPAMSTTTIWCCVISASRQGHHRAAGPLLEQQSGVPVRTYAGWDDPPPGFVTADLVAHGLATKGSFVHTLVLTDVAACWTEWAPLLVRKQLLTKVVSELREVLPFPLLGLDTDIDSVSMNEGVRDIA
jgi:hypothetical protein